MSYSKSSPCLTYCATRFMLCARSVLFVTATGGDNLRRRTNVPRNQP